MRSFVRARSRGADLWGFAWVVVLALVVGCHDEGEAPAVPELDQGRVGAGTANAVLHLLDRPSSMVDYRGELWGLEPMVSVEVALQPETQAEGWGVASLPWPIEGRGITVRREGKLLPEVTDAAALQARPESFLFVAETERSRATELVAHGGKATRDAVHESATLLLSDGDGFESTLCGVGDPARAVLRVAVPRAIQGRLELLLEGQVVADWELAGGGWREVEAELPTDRGRLVARVSAVDPDARKNLWLVRVAWLEIRRGTRDRVVLAQPGGEVVVQYRPRLPGRRERLELEADRPRSLLALGGNLDLIAVDQDLSVECGGEVFELRAGESRRVALRPGLHQLVSKESGALDIEQTGAGIVGYLNDAEATLRDHGLEPVAGGTSGKVFRRLDQGKERRAGLLLPTPSTVEFDEIELRPGDRLRWSLAGLDPATTGEAAPTAAIDAWVSWRGADGIEHELARLRWAADQGGFLESEVEIPLELCGSGSLLLSTEAGGIEGVAAFIADPRLVPAQASLAPNLLIYLVDTLRASSLSCYGNERLTSPAVDAFAAGCYRFEHFRAVASWTRPSVATMMTGLYPSHHGITDDGAALPAGVLTLAEHLRQAGYSNAASIANVQISARGVNFEQGFHRFLPPEAIGIADPKLQVAPSSRQVATLLPDWQRCREGEPRFLFLHSMDPHLPYLPPLEYRGTFTEGYDGPLQDQHLAFLWDLWKIEFSGRLGAEDYEYMRQVYDEEIRCQDDELGKLFAGLKEAGRLEDTVVVLLSDHGEEFHEHGRFTHAGRMWEELLRVPLLIYVPPNLRRERALQDPGVIPQALSQVDLMPTLLDLLGLPIPAMQGQSRLPLLRGDDGVSTPLYSFESHDLGALLDGPDKLLWEPQPLQYLHPFDGKCVQAGLGFERMDRLYNLDEDPGEQHDLANERPEKLAELQALRRAVEREQDAGGIPRHRAEARYGADIEAQLRALGYLDAGREKDADTDEGRATEGERRARGILADYRRESPDTGSLESQGYRLCWRRLQLSERRTPKSDRRKPLASDRARPERVYWLERLDDPQRRNVTISDLEQPGKWHPRFAFLIKLKRDVERFWRAGPGLPPCGQRRSFDIGSWETPAR